MGRWADAFHSLTDNRDTADTADTSLIEPPYGEGSVSTVSSVTGRTDLRHIACDEGCQH